MNRWKAFFAHLGLSAIVGLAAAGAVRAVWYPEPLYAAMGGSDLVPIAVVGVVILGPMLTLAVTNPRKPLRLLRMDLTLIAVLQAAGLVVAGLAVAGARPVYMVFTVDRFDLVTARDIREEELARVTDPAFMGLPWGSPRTIAVRTPSDPRVQVRVIHSALEGADLQTFPQYFVQYESLAARALQVSQPVSALRARNPGESVRIDRAISRLGLREDRTRFLPLKARSRDHSVLIDAWSGEVVGYLDVSPW